MAKKSVQPSLNAKSSNPVASQSLWSPTNCLSANDSEASLMKVERLEEISRLLPGTVEVVLPSLDERADWFRKDWVCFYYYPFDIRMPFPFSRLVSDFLVAMGVSPGQLMPFAWRILACLEAIEAKHGLGIDVDVIKYCYGLKKFKKARFGFTTKKTLILNVESVNDRHWKEDYFFANKLTMGDAGACLSERWITEDPPFICDDKDGVTKKIVEKVMALPIEDRIWPNCLGRPIRNSSPVDVKEYLAKGKFKEEGEASEAVPIKTVANRTRSKVNHPASKTSSTPQTLSSDSGESPK